MGGSGDMRKQASVSPFFSLSSLIHPLRISRILMAGVVLAACVCATTFWARQGGVMLRNPRQPISFEANQGQAGPRVSFLAHGPGYTIFLTGSGALLSLNGSQKPKLKSLKDLARLAAGASHPESAANHKKRFAGAGHLAPHASHTPYLLRVTLQGANPDAPVAGLDKLPGKSNDYIGDNPRHWYTGIPTYGRVKYRNIYPGIDLVYHGNQGKLEYDFVVAPGANPNRIQFSFRTARGVRPSHQGTQQAVVPRIAQNGDLVIQTPSGKVRFHAPHVYQPVAGSPAATTSRQPPPARRKDIKARYALEPGPEIGFRISSYDRRRPLVIDPVLVYASDTNLDGKGGGGTGIGVDGSGNAYILAAATGNQIVVLGLNQQGNSLIYTTYLGGQSSVTPGGIAVDSLGDAYIDGTATGAIPTTDGAYQATCPGVCNAPFAAKLSPSGSLAYSTYLGPSSASASAIAVDQSGDAYITGTIASNDLPVVNAFQSSMPCTGCTTAFVQKLNPLGSQLLYSTYFGPKGSSTGTAGTGIAVDTSGSAYVVGVGPVPLKNPLQQGVGGMFLAKFTPDGTGLVYSTQLGGSGNVAIGSNLVDTPTGVAVDTSDNVYITGDAVSPDFPMSMNAFKASCFELGGNCTLPQVFVLKVDSTGAGLAYSTLLGSGKAGGIAVDSAGNAWVTGTTSSNQFPVVQPIESSLQQNEDASSDLDAFVTRLKPDGTPDFSTFLGGSFSEETGAGVAVDQNGNAYVDGSSGGGELGGLFDFPIVNPLPSAHETGAIYNSVGLFAAKISVSSSGPAISLSPPYGMVMNLRDVSSSPLSINSIKPSSGLSLLGNTCGSSLPAGGGCTLILSSQFSQTYSPPTLTVSSNALGSPQQFSIFQMDLPTSRIFASPDNLQFPAQLAGTSSTTKTVTLTNLNYPDPLSISYVGVAAADPAEGISGDFTETNDCPTSLPAGASCNVNVQFRPTAGADGEERNSLTVLTSSPSYNYSFGLFGVRWSQSLAASAQTVQFGLQYVGATPLPRVVTLTNTDVQPVTVGGVSVTGPFTQVNNCSAPLAPHASCRVAVSFVPTSNTNATGKLTANFSGQGTPVTVNLAATGEVPADLDVSPFSLAFTNTFVNVGSTLPVTLKNVSSATVAISAFNLTTDYTETNDCNGSLAPGATCTVNVTFLPTVVGEQDGTLSIDFSGKGSPQIVPLTGNGTTPLLVTPDSLAFDSQALGTTSPAQDVDLHNQGATPVTINSVNVSGNFQLVSNDCQSSMQAYYACVVQIAFAPTVAGTLTGSLTINASDSTSPHTVSLSGVGAVVPEVSFSPTSLTFSPVENGSTSQPQAITMKNFGDAPLTITSLVATGDFAETNTCGSSLPAGSSCTISVTFSPTGGGQISGGIAVADNAPDNPQTVALTGTGSDFVLATPWGDVSSEKVNPGDQTQYGLSLIPQGGFSKTVSLACSGAPAGSTCTVTPDSVTLNGTNQQNVGVKVTTTAPSLVSPGPKGGPPPPAGFAIHDGWLALLLMALLAFAFRRRRRTRLLAGIVLLAALATGCGGGAGGGGTGVSSSPGTPSGTYTLTITGTSGSLSHQAKIQLVVL